MMKRRFAAVISVLFLVFVLVAGNEDASETIKNCPNLKSEGEPISSDATSYAAVGLPEGAFIATGIFAISNLVTHLETHPDTTITHLLISDMSSQDYDCQEDFLPKLRSSYFESPDNCSEKTYDVQYCVDLWKATITHNAEEAKNLTRRVLERASGTLESLTYLNYQSVYLPDFDDESWDDGDGSSSGGMTLPLTKPDVLFEFTYPRLTSLTTFQSISISDLGAHAQNFSALNKAQFSVRHGYDDKRKDLAEIQDKIPTLKMVRLVGDAKRFLPHEEYVYRHAGWGKSFLGKIIGTPEVTTKSSPSIPKSLTIIVQPDYHPFLDYPPDELIPCGNPAIEYSEFFSKFGGVDRPEGPEYENIHISIPIEEDHSKYGQLLFPVPRAVRYFVERVSGEGEGEWAIPERVRHSEELWWDRDFRRSKDTSDHIEL